MKLKTPSEINGKRCEEWQKLKAHIISEIEKIDEKTVWQEVEPSWWLEMSAIKFDLRFGIQIPKS